MALWNDPLMEERARVLVVDDDPRVVAAVRRSLVYEGYEVDVSGDGRRAIDLAREWLPDLVVLDVMLPELDGVEVCRRLRAGSDVPILMLTARDAVPDRVVGLDSGADDYLVKPFANEELLARVRTLLRRSRPQRAEVLRCDDLVLDVGAHQVRLGRRPVELTALEFQLLEHLMRNRGLVLTRAQILDAVWGFDAETASNVVDVYVGYLR
ncbi:MAG TPA: response regulator transcription factor, partial [Jiangellaceae bacterium]